jgi:hypothetical protein
MAPLLSKVSPMGLEPTSMRVAPMLVSAGHVALGSRCRRCAITRMAAVLPSCACAVPVQCGCIGKG